MRLELATFISLLAFAVSTASLTISLLGYLRDRSKVRVWSTVSWQSNGPDPDTPLMHVRIANIGRRPVVILNLVKWAKGAKWWRPINSPTLDSPIITTLEQLDEYKRKSLAHLLATKLAEGEVLEMEFRPDDCHEFLALHEDPPLEATSLQIEDVAGRVYPVKGSEEHIQIMLNAWKKCNF